MTLLAGSVGLVNQWSTSGTISAQTLVDGTFYQFSVVAVNDIGPGSQSTVVGIYAASVPSAPNAPTLVS
jgi:hypothetical protein